MQHSLNNSIVDAMRQAALISEQASEEILAEMQQTGASETSVLSKHVPPQALALAKKSVEYGTRASNWKA